MNALVERFERIRVRDPHRALIHLPARDLTLTATDLHAMRTQFESALAAARIGAGHTIVSAMGNRAEFVALLLAAWSVRAAVIPVDAGAHASDCLGLARRFGAAAIVWGAPLPAGVDVTAVVPGIYLSTPDTEARVTHAGALVLKITSGSTGAPKAVLAGEASLIGDVEQIVAAMDIRPDDTQIAVIPLSHSYGLGNLVLPLIAQGTAFVLRDSFVPQAVMADARAYRARVMPGVPFMFQHFVEHQPEGGWPPSLTLLISAGARLAPETLRAFEDRFGIRIHSFYGTSETGGIAYDGSEAPGDEAASVGRPMPGVTVVLRDDEGGDAGGRVYVRSRAVCAGYVGGDEPDASLSDGGFLTGDYGRFLPDGRLVLTGRVSSFINVAGRKVQPGEVERFLRQMPGLTDVCVIAAADPARGEQVAAVVVGGAELTLSAVRRYCAGRLPSYKIPGSWCSLLRFR